MRRRSAQHIQQLSRDGLWIQTGLLQMWLHDQRNAAFAQKFTWNCNEQAQPGKDSEEGEALAAKAKTDVGEVEAFFYLRIFPTF